MRSRTSFFNPGLFRKNMLRFWPLWAAYGAIWLLIFAGGWQSLARYGRLGTLADSVVGAGWLMGILLGCSFGLVSAMCVFSYLHSARSSYFFHALPTDRAQLFGTSLISGLAFVMVPNLIFYVLGTLWCSIFTMATLWQSIQMLTMWLLELTTQYLFYYGASVFCALLTGHLLAMPFLYGALNFVVPVGEWMLRALCTELIWGFEYGTVQLHWLSPLYHELNNGSMPDVVKNGQMVFAVDGYHLLIGAVGLVLMALSWLLYKHRHLEVAGDVVATPWLRPVFKYGLGLYGAVPVGVIIYAILTQNLGSGDLDMAHFLVLCFSLVLGGFICYLAAAMLLEKSAKVLKKHASGYLVVAAALVLLLIGLQVDAFGLETWTPDPEDVTAVRMWGSASSVNSTDPATIRSVINTHQVLLGYRDELENPDYTYEYDHYDITLINGSPVMVRTDLYYDSTATSGNLVIYDEPVTKEDVIAGVTVEKPQIALDKEVYRRSIVKAYTCSVSIRYTMKNGYTVQRNYEVPVNQQNKNDPLRTALQDMEEYRLQEKIGVDRDYIRVDSMTLEFEPAYELMGSRVVDSMAMRQAVLNALEADYRAGNLTGTQYVLLEDRAYFENYTGWRMEYQLVTNEPKTGTSTDGLPADATYEDYNYYSVNLPYTAVNTLSVLESLGILKPSECLQILG